MGAPMVAERQAADAVKQTAPILAIFGKPPYRRLRRGEVERLVGADMARRWQDLIQPVRDAGFGRSLNAFPDLYIAFYRWALWRLFEADGACGRGVLGVSSPTGDSSAAEASAGFAGCSAAGSTQYACSICAVIARVLDPLRSRWTRTCSTSGSGSVMLIAYATGNQPEGGEAEVRYADAWNARAFARLEELRVGIRCRR